MATDVPAQTDARASDGEASSAVDPIEQRPQSPPSTQELASDEHGAVSTPEFFLRRWLRWPQTPAERGHFSFRASMFVHALLMISLALWAEPAKPPAEALDFSAGWQDEGDLDNAIIQQADIIATPSAATAPIEDIAAATSATLPTSLPLSPVEIGDASATRLSTSAVNSRATGGGGITSQAIVVPGGIPHGGGLEGRSQRGKLAYDRGATPQSEAAVERGLQWLVAHQFHDGSWHFDHALDDGPCNGYCRHAGTNGSSTGATAMALLAFYGAGYTHRAGPYQDELKRGLYYLGGRMLLTQNGGDLQEGTMYAQGLSAIALCEAYAMSGDENLRPFAEQAIRFILYAQDKKGGGWRYTPGEPGDTTMHGWQLMALKSASLAGIHVPSPAWQLASEFLDGVQTDRGAAYGYRDRQRRTATTAVGLLCRMYTGWERDRDALVRGVAYLDKTGPAPTNMYYNYYATQVMHHYGGEPWQRWNARMREHLITTQANVGHESGSWHFDDQHGNVGGRLYSTAMSVMTLEVYYRYMPLYGDRAVTESF